MRLTLELSLKPFRDMSEKEIRRVCTEIVQQWQHLIQDADEISFLLWTADGSEILDYKGRLDGEIEWARYVGVANPPEEYPEDPKRQSVAAWPRLYVENPTKVTYADLRRIISVFHTLGSELSGKPVVVGATFDPGPEFAKSPFKYQRHAEIATGGTMGKGTWVSCGAVLEADSESYAGFPSGIPAGTTLGTFLGRQSQQFLSDLGFDYIWFSNGFGFAQSAWHLTGELFDGTSYYPERAGKNRDAILRFWREFRAECPLFPVETRGSNFSTSMDLASDGCPLEDIYGGNFNLVAPPNSPWAAMDGDYGLEIVGYLSKIATLPSNEQITWRYYLHDPWFLNSPWLDRYGREPHDIYMPLALARLDGKGQITPFSNLSFLTIDNSHGELVAQCPIEVIPHVQEALRHRPDEPGPIVWIYPFSEYHEMTFGPVPRLEEVFFGDWFLRGAVNHGFPLSSVISSENFLSAWKATPERFEHSVLLSPVPQAGSELEGIVLDALARGYSVLLYGPVTHAGAKMMQALNLRLDDALEGEFSLGAEQILHKAALSAGGLDTVAQDGSAEGWKAIAMARQGAHERVYAVAKRSAEGGKLVWVRGTFCASITEAKLPVPHDERQWWHAERLLREALQEFGVSIEVEKPLSEIRDPLFVISASRNGLYFSGYQPSTLAKLKIRFPDGAPLLVGCDAWIESGHAVYQMPRAWHRECRVFVQQATDGPVSCAERWSGEVGIRRRMLLNGLQQATVVFYLEPDTELSRLRMAVNDPWPYVSDSLPYEISADRRSARIENITGSLLISW